MFTNQTHQTETHRFVGRQRFEGSAEQSTGNIRLEIDEDDLVYLSLSDAEKGMRRAFLSQVHAAFSKEPDLNGVVEGVRAIALGKEGSRSSLFPSTKNAPAGMLSIYLTVESRLEARYAMELERNPNVRAFRSQAIKLELPGLNSSVYPDFLVLDQGGYLHLREMKRDVKALSPEKIEGFKHIQNVISKWGVTFAVVDTSSLPHEKKYENLQWLNTRIHAHPSAEEIKEFFSHNFAKSTYGELKQAASNMGLDESIVSYLLFTDELKTNWMKRLDDSSEVSR